MTKRKRTYTRASGGNNFLPAPVFGTPPEKKTLRFQGRPLDPKLTALLDTLAANPNQPARVATVLTRSKSSSARSSLKNGGKRRGLQVEVTERSQDNGSIDIYAWVVPHDLVVEVDGPWGD